VHGEAEIAAREKCRTVNRGGEGENGVII